MSGLKVGLNVPGSGTRLQVGGNTTRNKYSTGPEELFTMDYTPSLGNDLDDPTYPATYVWALEESSGATSLVESRVGGGTHDLDASGGSSNHFVGQTATGIYDGTNLSSRKCLECAPSGAVGDRFALSSGALDSSAGAIAIRFRFRIPVLVAEDFILGTRDASGSGNEGWWVKPTSGGPLAFAVRDTGGTSVTVTSTVSVNDGCWHEAELQIVWGATNTIGIRVDGESQVTASISSVTQANTAGAAFAIGGTARLEAPDNVQIERVLGWEASDGAESIHNTAWSDVSKLGATPSGVNSTYDTVPAYSGAASVPCDAGNDGLWYLASGDKSTDDYPVGYSSLLETRGAPNGFGRWTSASWTNLITRSEQLENAAWSTGTISVSASASDLIDNKLGFRMARKLTATTANDYLGFPVTLAANTPHAIYAYIAGNGGTVSGRIILYDATGADEQDSVAFSVADGVLELVGKQMTSDATNTAHEVRIEIDTDTEAINVCHVVCAARVSSESNFWESGVPVMTFGATAALPTLYGTKSSVAAGEWFENKGSIDFSSVVTSGRALTYMWATSIGDSDAAASFRRNRFGFNYASTTTIRAIHYDETGSAFASDITETVDAALGIRCRYEWNATSVVSGTDHARLRTTHSGGSADSTDGASAWDSTDEQTLFAAGKTPGSGYYVTGLSGYIKVWKGPGAFD